MVDDGVNGNSRLTRLAVANDELALATSDGNHRVDGLDARLQRLLHRLTVDDTGGFAFQRHLEKLAFNGTLTVNGLSNGIDDTAQQAFADRQRGNAAGTLHHVALVDGAHLAEHHNTDVVLLKVLDNTLIAVVKLYKLAALCIVQAINTGNAVAHSEHRAHFLELGVDTDLGQLFLQYCRYFGRFDI